MTMPIILTTIINILAPIVANMGLLLLRERVIRQVVVVTLKKLQPKDTNSLTADVLKIVEEALQPSPPVR